MRRRRNLLAVILAGAAVAAAVIAVALLHQVMAPHQEAAPRPRPSITTARPAPASVRQRAFSVADRFCQPGDTPDQWQRALAPVLTSAARTMFAATEPANVPCEHVDEASGQAIGDQQTATDAAWQFAAATGGPITVTLHRDAPDGSWLASYVQPGR